MPSPTNLSEKDDAVKGRASLKPFCSKQYRKRTLHGTNGEECCLCGRDTSGSHGAIHVPVNHETGEFATDDECGRNIEAHSYYPIGQECVKKWGAKFAATRVRFRQSKSGLVCYDEQPSSALSRQEAQG